MRSYSPTVTPAGTSIWISTFAVAMGSSVNQEIGCFQLHPTLCRHRLAAKGQNAQRCTYQRESQFEGHPFCGEWFPTFRQYIIHCLELAGHRFPHTDEIFSARLDGFWFVLRRFLFGFFLG